MSKLDVKTHLRLLKEAKGYYKDAKTADRIHTEAKKGAVVLTQEHIMEWLEVFYDDRIMLDGCNHATVKR
jgi:hypothetical protein